MNTITSFLKKNPCYIAGEKFTPKGIMVSMVGCPQPSAKVFINNWNRESCDKVCPHILVDANDGKVYQILPYDVRGRYAKTAMDSANDYIQVFLCEPSQIKYQGGEKFTIVGDKEKALDAVDRVFASATDVCKSLCAMLGFDAMTQIVSSEEGKNSPKEPNVFWRQLCRWNAVPYSMTELVHRVSDPVPEPDTTITDAEVIENGVLPYVQAAAISVSPVPLAPTYDEPAPIPVRLAIAPSEEEEQAKEESFEYPDEYLIDIQIDVPNLRIRKGPGTGAGCEPIGKYTGAGRFQITEIQNGSGSQKGWGKLASGEGWVSMDFVRVIE